NRPAVFAYLCVPLSWFSYRTASMLAVLGNFGLLGLMVWKLPAWFVAEPEMRWALRACLLVFYPFLKSIGAGQDTLLLTLIVAYALHLESARRQGLAGIILALGLFKPHLLWTLSLALVAERKWKMLGPFAATAAALAVGCWATVGTAGMGQWMALLQASSTD